PATSLLLPLSAALTVAAAGAAVVFRTTRFGLHPSLAASESAWSAIAGVPKRASVSAPDALSFVIWAETSVVVSASYGSAAITLQFERCKLDLRPPSRSLPSSSFWKSTAMLEPGAVRARYLPYTHPSAWEVGGKPLVYGYCA